MAIAFRSKEAKKIAENVMKGKKQRREPQGVASPSLPQENQQNPMDMQGANPVGALGMGSGQLV